MAGDSARSLAETLRAATGAPGAGVAILREGAADVGAVGRRSAAAAPEVADDDLWHIGSNTKSMTALLVARLAEAGRIGWDDTVSDVLGPRIGACHAAYAGAGYAALLSHRTGLPANLGLFATLRLGGADAARDVMADRRAYARRVLRRPPPTTPGAFAYSNAGYVVAAAMLEAQTGLSWEALIRSEVFAALGLDSAGFGPPGTPGALDQPLGHRRRLFGGLAPVPPGPLADNVPALAPAGRVHASLGDMARYLGAHARRDPALLPREGWDRLHVPIVPETDYALGWGVGGDGRIFHDGSNTLWYARMIAWPGEDRALFAAVNAPAGDGLEAAAAEIERRAFRRGG